MATLNEAKAQIGVEVLNLNRATTEDGVATPWFRHWDNNTRVAVSIHEDSVKELQANPENGNVVVQTETRQAAKGEYISHRLVLVTPAEIQM